MQNAPRLAISSITYAIQARELLSRHGISVSIVRLHPTETPNGCAFGLEIPRRQLESARVMLKKAEIKFTDIQNRY